MGEIRATAQGTDSETPPRHVEIKLVAPTEDGQGLEVVLGELLSRLQVSVRFSKMGSIDTRQILTERRDEPPAVARVWIDLRDTSRITLYLTGNSQDRVLVRHVPLINRIDEVAREEVAQIVENTVDALLIGGRIGVATDESARTTPKADAIPQEAARGLALDLGIGYQAQAWSDSHPFLHGPAVLLALSGRAGALHPGVWMSGELRFPTTIDGDPISTRLDQGAFRLLAFADWPVSKRWALRAGLGGGVDWVRISPLVKEGAKVDLAPARFATIPMLRGLVSATYAFTRKSEVFCGVAADFDVMNTRYLVERDTGDEVVFQPWRLRPMAIVGIASDVIAH
jgi:hypothetical protein